MHDHPRFKAAAVQAGPIYRDAPHYFDLEATLEKAVGLIEKAGQEGARLIVFPEGWLPCFPYWSLDHTSDRAIFADIWAKLLWSSIEVPSRETEVLGAAAKKANAYVAMGLNERDKKFSDRMYNSVLYLSPSGEILGTHRKICNTVQERFFHTPGDGGENLKAVFETEIGKIGGSLCGEHAQLLLSYHWMMQGIQTHCSLWPGQTRLKTVTDISTRALCFNTGTFGVLAATYIPEQDQPKNFYSNSLFNGPQAFSGGSGIVNPLGEYIAGPVYDEETIVYGDIDLSDIDRSRHAVSLTGIYSRWDLLNIHVRDSSYEPVLPMEPPEARAALLQEADVEDLAARVRQLEQQISQVSEKTNQEADEEIPSEETLIPH
jgi:predicted amidohydrolase